MISYCFAEIFGSTTLGGIYVLFTLLLQLIKYRKYINKQQIIVRLNKKKIPTLCFDFFYLLGDIPPEVASAKFPLSTKSVFCSKLCKYNASGMSPGGPGGGNVHLIVQKYSYWI